MKQVLAGFAAHGKPSRHVSAGSQAALHGVTNSHILFLHFFTYFDAGAMVSHGLLAHVGEVVVEHNGAAVHRQRHHEVRVHHTFVSVDHEVGIDPQVEGTSLASGCYRA